MDILDSIKTGLGHAARPIRSGEEKIAIHNWILAGAPTATPTAAAAQSSDLDKTTPPTPPRSPAIRAAELLGIDLSSLYRKLEGLGLAEDVPAE